MLDWAGSHEDVALARGDLVVTDDVTIGDTPGTLASRLRAVATGWSCYWFDCARQDPAKVADPSYRYFLHSSAGQRQSRHAVLASGTADLNTRGSVTALPMLAVPPLAEQRAIAHILGTLDDKIELNRRMNETLEAMARALFKSWFVDFDPVRAKAEGRDPACPKPLADLFPESPRRLGTRRDSGGVARQAYR